ncbi:NrdH-redoxin [Candidatus Woesearchaeota archaeon]|nr:NrdH-redoxin [Candidatus Woesearchaeota archaeon]
MTVKIYTTPTCPWCKKVKEFFKENNIEYEEIDVASNQEAQKEMIDKSGQMSVPVIDIDGEIIVGYDVEKLKKALNIGA